MSRERRSQHHFVQDRQWFEVLHYAVERSVAEPPNARFSKPEMRVLSVSSSGNRIELELRFRCGRYYENTDLLEILDPYSTGWWRRLRQYLSDVTDRSPPALALVVHGVVEAGAQFRELVVLGRPLASPACNYTDGPFRERRAVGWEHYRRAYIRRELRRIRGVLR